MHASTRTYAGETANLVINVTAQPLLPPSITTITKATTTTTNIQTYRHTDIRNYVHIMWQTHKICIYFYNSKTSLLVSLHFSQVADALLLLFEHFLICSCATHIFHLVSLFCSLLPIPIPFWVCCLLFVVWVNVMQAIYICFTFSIKKQYFAVYPLAANFMLRV